MAMVGSVLLWLTACTLAAGLEELPMVNSATIELAPQDEERVRFIAIGDIGTTGECTYGSGIFWGKTAADGAHIPHPQQRKVAKAVREVCADRGCDFVALLGDNVYDRGFDSPHTTAKLRDYDADVDKNGEVFGKMLKSYGDMPSLVVLGNHDWGKERALPVVAGLEYDWIAANDNVYGAYANYRADVGVVSLLGIDSNLYVRYPKLAKRAATVGAWSAFDTLLEGFSKSNRPWKIAMAHHPPVSFGLHGDAGRYLDGGLPLWPGTPYATLVRDRIAPQLDLFLGGHDHGLYFFTSIERMGWAWHSREVPGDMAVLVSGSGGKCAEGASEGRRQRIAARTGAELALARSLMGFAWLEATPTTLTVTLFDEQPELLGSWRRTKSSGWVQVEAMSPNALEGPCPPFDTEACLREVEARKAEAIMEAEAKDIADE